jgi:hypothetical protein
MTTVCHQAAMLNCHFDGHDKIVSAELVFDVMNFINQLQVCGVLEFLVFLLFWELMIFDCYFVTTSLTFDENTILLSDPNIPFD